MTTSIVKSETILILHVKKRASFASCSSVTKLARFIREDEALLHQHQNRFLPNSIRFCRYAFMTFPPTLFVLAFIHFNETRQKMAKKIFESDRVYDDTDDELDLIAMRDKRAQWRHRRVGPAFMKFGRRVKYHGEDLNAWVTDNLVDTAPQA